MVDNFCLRLQYSDRTLVLRKSIIIIFSLLAEAKSNCFRRGFESLVTGKSFSEALIFASPNPQYEKRLFIELRVQYMKTTSSEHIVYINCSECQYKNKTICVHNMFWACSFHALLTYCGLVAAIISASDKDLSVQSKNPHGSKNAWLGLVWFSTVLMLVVTSMLELNYYHFATTFMGPQYCQLSQFLDSCLVAIFGLKR